MFIDEKTGVTIHADLDTTIIRATLRPQDLIPAFLEVLRDTMEYVQVMNFVPAYAMEDEDSEWWGSEDASYFLNETLWDTMCAYAPDGYYFGNTEVMGVILVIGKSKIMKTFRLKVTDDEGVSFITVVTIDKETAIRMVCIAVGCPESAITPQYTVEEANQNYIQNWDESLGTPYVVLNPDGFDEFGEAFSLERANQLCDELNGVWRVSDITNAKHLGCFEFQTEDGEYHNFEVLDTETRLVFGSFCNSGFIESGYMIKDDGFSTDQNLEGLLDNLRIYYEKGKEFATDIICNERM